MKAGLEIHQQLATGKLFCACPAELSEDVSFSFVRRLRAAGGENRAVDAAASLQAARGLLYRYEVVPPSCLVEMDDEPPHPLNADALETALLVALLLDARPVDEVEVMRKIVVDGSTTAGFQRTALIATGGHIEVRGRTHRIETVCLEEDAARRTGDSPDGVTYRLDRLGIPLIEIATAPDIHSGVEAKEVAQEIGALLRATGRVRRGIGTIREDVNVSTEGGRRVEIKGVQELRMIQEYVDREVERQRVLLELRDGLVRAGAYVPSGSLGDVTDLVRGVPTGPLAEVNRSGAVALVLALPGFAGRLRSPTGTEVRLGSELAAQARAAGLGGLLHSDELPGHGIDERLVAEIRQALSLTDADAFVLVVAPSRERAEAAVDRIEARAQAALEGVPEETRDPLPDGSTRFSRPLPGRDRMYPETDVPPIPISEERLERLRRALPERPSARRERLTRVYSLPLEVVRQLEAVEAVDEFEALVQRGHAPGIVARLLTQDAPAALLTAPGSAPFSLDTLDSVLAGAANGLFSKEGIPAVLAAFVAGATTLETATQRAGFSGGAVEDLDALADRVVRANMRLVQERGEAALSPLMGDVMREVRGRRDGKEVAAAVRRSIARLRADGSASTA
ncbi:MAG TPA: Glu-tRNA(Gln) amidotransferase subunit GatE [Thermoplasmata archaeon]|nr:Glu-tRNA(Gln) amidotransferase subunit GatE [Thermoplasmata archaeon]